MTAMEAVLAAFCLANLLLTLAVVRRLRVHTERLDRLTDGEPPLLQPGDPVGEFEVPTVGGSLAAATDLAAGGLIAVVSPGCGSCEEAVPGLVAALAEPGRPPMVIVVAAEPVEAEAMVRALGPDAPVVIEAPVTGAVQRALGIREYPSLVAVADGAVTALGHDVRDLPAVLAAIPRPVR
ncbi:hypothetical protein [Micromonospora sp. DT31]|uniref:hypothetical protein n=1 Tax=Micromonospora sp. DT31 TaxID=3393434 RepID=UPI003CECCC6C